MNKEDFKIGQIVYLKPVGNNARYVKDDILNHIEEYKISKIGRKYLEVNQGEWRTAKFDLEKFRQNIDYPDWEIFFSLQEIKDKIEYNDLVRDMRDIFGSYGKINLSLDQLRRIKIVIDEGK